MGSTSISGAFTANNLDLSFKTPRLIPIGLFVFKMSGDAPDEFEQPSYVVEENIKESLDDKVDEEVQDEPIDKTRAALKKLTKPKLIEECIISKENRKDGFWRVHSISASYMAVLETLRSALFDTPENSERVLVQFNGINSHKFGFFACQKCGESFEQSNALQLAVVSPCGDLYCRKCLDGIQSGYGNCERCKNRTTRLRKERDILGEIEAERKKKKKK